MEEEVKKTEHIEQTPKQLFWEIVRFLIVGGTATLVDYAVFYLFRQWLLPARLISGGAWNITSLVIATAFGFCAGLAINWILSVRFVFRAVRDEKEVRSRRSLMIFTVIGLIGLGITELGVALLVLIFPEITLFGRTAFLLPWEEWLAKAIMTCIVLVFNYVARKYFVFRS